MPWICFKWFPFKIGILVTSHSSQFNFFFFFFLSFSIDFHWLIQSLGTIRCGLPSMNHGIFANKPMESILWHRPWTFRESQATCVAIMHWKRMLKPFTCTGIASNQRKKVCKFVCILLKFEILGFYQRKIDYISIHRVECAHFTQRLKFFVSFVTFVVVAVKLLCHSIFIGAIVKWSYNLLNRLNVKPLSIHALEFIYSALKCLLLHSAHAIKSEVETWYSLTIDTYALLFGRLSVNELKIVDLDTLQAFCMRTRLWTVFITSGMSFIKFSLLLYSLLISCSCYFSFFFFHCLWFVFFSAD